MVTKAKTPAKKPAAKKAATPKAATKRNRVGRPSSYKEEYAEQAYKFCLLGATDKTLAEFFEVAVSTIYEWKRSVPEFSESVKRGQKVADANVANALYQRAIGYSHGEDDIRTVSVGGGMSQIEITPTVKHYPPDTGAATLWLKNRQPHLWRDRVENVHQNPDGSPIDMSLKVSFVTPKRKD